MQRYAPRFSCAVKFYLDQVRTGSIYSIICAIPFIVLSVLLPLQRYLCPPQVVPQVDRVVFQLVLLLLVVHSGCLCVAYAQFCAVRGEFNLYSPLILHLHCCIIRSNYAACIAFERTVVKIDLKLLALPASTPCKTCPDHPFLPAHSERSTSPFPLPLSHNLPQVTLTQIPMPTYSERSAPQNYMC